MADNRKISIFSETRGCPEGQPFCINDGRESTKDIFCLGGRMKYDKKQALNIIVKAAEGYQKKLQDRSFLIIYQNDKGIGSVRVGFRGNHFLHMTGVRAVLSVGFRFGEKVDFPVTLYNEDIKKLSNPTRKVLAIFSKRFDEAYYVNCTYLSKGQEIENLLVSDECKKEIKI